MKRTFAQNLLMVGKVLAAASITLIVYVSSYVFLIERQFYVAEVGFPYTYSVPVYRYMNDEVFHILQPIHWIDKNVVRPKYWKADSE